MRLVFRRRLWREKRRGAQRLCRTYPGLAVRSRSIARFCTPLPRPLRSPGEWLRPAPAFAPPRLRPDSTSHRTTWQDCLGSSPSVPEAARPRLLPETSALRSTGSASHLSPHCDSPSRQARVEHVGTASSMARHGALPQTSAQHRPERRVSCFSRYMAAASLSALGSVCRNPGRSVRRKLHLPITPARAAPPDSGSA